MRREIHAALHDLDPDDLQHRRLVGDDLLLDRQLRLRDAHGHLVHERRLRSLRPVSHRRDELHRRDAKFADYLTSGTIFTYLPPNSHLVTSSSLGAGTGAGAIVTQDGSSTLPRLHVDINLQLRGGLVDGYRLVDDIAFRNGVRACSGVASC